MGTPRPPQPVKLVAGLLAASAVLLEEARQVLENRYGTIDAASLPVPWNVSDYYEDEMGTPIVRQFVSFAPLVDAARIAAIKLETNTLEESWRQDGKRKVNIDPGYVGGSKLVLATTKDAAQRIYLHSGIYAEPTLRYESGSYRPYTHTYPDYAAAAAVEFFNQVRARYLEQVRLIATAARGK